MNSKNSINSPTRPRENNRLEALKLAVERHKMFAQVKPQEIVDTAKVFEQYIG